MNEGRPYLQMWRGVWVSFCKISIVSFVSIGYNQMAYIAGWQEHHHHQLYFFRYVTVTAPPPPHTHTPTHTLPDTEGVG